VNLRFNQEVLDILPHRQVVRVRDRGSSVEREQSFQNLLVTLPFPILSDMRLAEMSSRKTAAIRNMGYASACKDLLSYESRFWEEEGIFGGRSKSDGPNQTVQYFREAYYPMDNLPPEDSAPAGLSFKTESGDELKGLFSLYVGSTTAPPTAAVTAPKGGGGDVARPATLLGAYTLNAGAKALQRLPLERRRAAVIDSLRAIHGDAVERPVEYLAWSWDEYRWTRGGVGITEPNYLVTHWQDAKRPEGRVYFAGEHLSIAPAWIQGSLESSLREVEAMLRAGVADSSTQEGAQS